MTQAEKELLFKDLCGRLPYEVMIQHPNGHCKLEIYEYGRLDSVFIYADEIHLTLDTHDDGDFILNEKIKPYLRPMSSMTEEEILELYKIAYTTWYSDSLYYKQEEWITFRDSILNNVICFKSSIWLSDINKVIDWLNAHHFDYRGLIPMGLALEAPEGMYKAN